MFKKKSKKVYVVSYNEYNRAWEDGFPYRIVVGVFNKLCDASLYVSAKGGNVHPELVTYPNEDGVKVANRIWATATRDKERVSYYYYIEEMDLN